MLTAPLKMIATLANKDQEIKFLRRDLKKYEELLDTYRAIAVAEREKKTGTLKKLTGSLADLMN